MTTPITRTASSEARELEKKKAELHYNLGLALEHKHNFRDALQEYRTAYELDPQNFIYRKAYKRLVEETGR